MASENSAHCRELKESGDMGGGNAQKSAKSREKNMKKAAAAGAGSMLKTNEAAKSIQCKVCMQSFVSTLSHSELRKHAENKHPKLPAVQCFPFLTAP